MVVARVGSSCMLRRASVRLTNTCSMLGAAFEGKLQQNTMIPACATTMCTCRHRTLLSPSQVAFCKHKALLADQPWLHRRALCNHHFCSMLSSGAGPKRVLHSKSMHLCHACLPHLHVAGVDGGQPRQQAVAMAAAGEAALLDALTCNPGAQCLQEHSVLSDYY